MAFVSTGDPLFTLGDSRPIYEQLVAPYKRMIDDVLLRRGRTSASGAYFSPKPLRADLSGLGENAVLVGKVRSRTAPPGHRQPATDNQPWATGVNREPQTLVTQTLVTRSRLGTPARVSGYWPSSCLRRCMAT